MARVKIGSGHLAAMARLGMAELRQAASMTSGSVEQPTPLGMAGAPTPGEVGQARGVAAAANQEGVAPARQSIASMRAAAAAQQQSNNGQQMQQQRLRGGRAM